MHAGQLAALRTPDGVKALTTAAELAGGDPLAAAAALRSSGVPAGLAAAALTQADLRRRAAGKFGADAGRMFFTRAGLEQATRSAVATRRAARLRAAGVRTLADLGCGIGADAIAAARSGITVYAWEADPGTAAVAAANAEVLGLAGITVTAGDATAADLSGVDAVFCDPARRRDGRRVFDPAAYSPPWDFVAALPARVARTVLKLAPGIDHALIPPGAEAEWVSVRAEVVEAAFWCGPLAEVPRRATLVGAGELTGTGDARAPVGPVGRYLFDPDGAVVRAHLVAEFAALIGGHLADPEIAYVYADTPVPTPYARCIEIEEVLPFSLKRLRALLRARGVGRLEILKRGSALDPDRLRRDLRLSGPAAASLVLTRVAGAPVALIGSPTSGTTST
ncbi:SAM-dependent methyltransferase [Phytohabitans sp. ZYX-F-186]|uniref:SAM-dependent methyltransferase n=1 Tax=Phytohabitans maris TaxID=3071409 RepID=A0ABU0Z8C1_9ACTN|nr:SAM-dependent methyltransferase [Phytohabitans sp. ZYX-F-186]MDQ7903301.1 SAM-dependent methyltransferase [Phytohabitans sp. ZYX-F-186]